MKDKMRAEKLGADQLFINNSTDANATLAEGEIEQLKTQFSKSNASNETSWNSSVLRVLFKNESFARKYKVKIEKFLKELLEEGEEFVVYHPSHNNVEQEYEDNHQAFHIDKANSDTLGRTDADIPHYLSSYEDTLNCDGSKVIEKEEEEERPSMFTCFNCLGNHHMKKCPEKLDRSRINANKKEVLLAGNTIRYHTEEQNNLLKAGILSTQLRNALGLKENELPKFIYHMRVIGYPPGWMNEAILEQSGLSLYDIHGKAITGEHSSPSSEKGTLYDGTKFIDFPGFNSPVPDGYKEECQALNMPPLQSHQQLNEALKSPNIIISSNICKRKQFTTVGDKDSKKSKKEEKPCSSHSQQVYERDLTSPQHPGLKFDYNTPECKRSNKRHSMSVSMSPGTPILKQGNPYQKLPGADKFAQGITEHLPFENLPDAVGTFEKMRGVINNVQKKLNTIQYS